MRVAAPERRGRDYRRHVQDAQQCTKVTVYITLAVSTSYPSRLLFAWFHLASCALASVKKLLLPEFNPLVSCVTLMCDLDGDVGFLGLQGNS